MTSTLDLLSEPSGVDVDDVGNDSQHDDGEMAVHSHLMGNSSMSEAAVFEVEIVEKDDSSPPIEVCSGYFDAIIRDGLNRVYAITGKTWFDQI